jgi:1-deoxy-D-xylulose-5-phosphate synthase
MSSTTKYLDKINFPSDLKQFSLAELQEIAQELRQATIGFVAKTGGHLGAGLGVIEITCALHYVFNAPQDKIIWDVGHQSYPHKILTGRKHLMETIRKPNGLSGFTKRKESEFDPFGAGHSSTSISAAVGIAVAKHLTQETGDVIAVIGDGAMSAGMAYEAMNNAGALKECFKNNRLIIILNDNEMSIAKPTGAMANYFSRLASSKSYLKIRQFSQRLANHFPEQINKYPRKLEKSIKEWWMGGNIFEEMGFYYIGPVDGHKLDLLVPILQNIQQTQPMQPILLHCITEKGKGYSQTMPTADKLHAVSTFDHHTGIQHKSKSNAPSYSQVFGTKLVLLAQQQPNIVAITAAMPSGTGLDIFALEHKNKFFDVGIAEQHAVTFAAGLATENIVPFCAIYSTFLQRSYDQIIHDVAIQNLPVRFVIDRSGFVGADGPTHAGSFDISYLINLPNMILMAPTNGLEFIQMLNTACAINNQPSAIRIPRATTEENINYNDNQLLPIGKGKIVLLGQKIAIIAYGTIIKNAFLASQMFFASYGFDFTIINAMFAKPLDESLILNTTKNHDIILTIEEGATGGFGNAVANLLLQNNCLDTGKIVFRSLFMPDRFIEQNTIEAMQEEANLSPACIFEIAKKLYETSQKQHQQ